MKHQYIRAFTLVELLVVVLIITILMALLLPTIENAREAAYSVSCANRQRQLMVLTHEYGQDYRMLLGQKLTITQPGGSSRTFFGYHLLYEGGYLSPDNFNVINSSNLNSVANAWRKGNSCLVMCPAARFHGHSMDYQAGGLDELVHIGDKNRWRDLWSTNDTSWTWGGTALTDQFNPYYGASAVSSYAMIKETRDAWKIGSTYIYKPLRFVKNPSRKVWWIEARGPDLGSLGSFHFTASSYLAGNITGGWNPHIRLPHPYTKGGNLTCYDGHVTPYSMDDMIEFYTITCNFNWWWDGHNKMQDFPYEFIIDEEFQNLAGLFYK